MFDKVLSMPPVLNIPGFWIAQDSYFVSGSQCARVLNMQGSENASGFEYASILNILEF